MSEMTTSTPLSDLLMTNEVSLLRRRTVFHSSNVTLLRRGLSVLTTVGSTAARLQIQSSKVALLEEGGGVKAGLLFEGVGWFLGCLTVDVCKSKNSGKFFNVGANITHTRIGEGVGINERPLAKTEYSTEERVLEERLTTRD